MHQTGEIIYLDKLFFTSHLQDRKKNRPCLVLFSELDSNNREKIYFCPTTTSRRQFNKYPQLYHLLEHPTYDNQLSFVELGTIRYCYNEKYLHNTKIILKKEGFDVIRKLCSLNLDKRHGYTKYLDNIFHYMDHFVRKEELDEKVPKTYQKTKR